MDTVVTVTDVKKIGIVKSILKSPPVLQRVPPKDRGATKATRDTTLKATTSIITIKSIHTKAAEDTIEWEMTLLPSCMVTNHLMEKPTNIPKTISLSMGNTMRDTVTL